MIFCKEELTALLFYQVTLCANTVMTFYRKLLVDLEGFGNGVASVIITARYQHFPGLPQHTALTRVCQLQLPRRSVL